MVKTINRKVSHKTVVHEHFKSLTSLVNTMDDRTLNKAFQSVENPSSMRNEIGEKKPWSGTETYHGATELIKTGFRDPLEKMKKAIVKIGRTEQRVKPKLKNDFVGFVPHVPHTIMNLPMTMINKEKQINKSKNIHLIYSFGASANVKPNDLIKGGVNFISLVNSLEKQGYTVKIDVMTSFSETNTLACMTVNVKEYGQRLNLLKLTFPLVSPAMFRRVSFKWLETTPENKDTNFTGGYGRPLSPYFSHNAQEEAEYLREIGVIKNSNTYFLSVYNAMHCKTVEGLAKEIGIIK